MKFWRKCVLFYIGGAVYMTLEFLWRGRSHGTMFLLGGACFLILGQLGSRWQWISLPVKMLAGASAVTALELITGLVVNRDYAIWDYRFLPYQYLGQISLVYSLLWVPVSLCGMALYQLTERKLFQGR